MGFKYNIFFIYVSKRREEDYIYFIIGRFEGSLYLVKYLLRGIVSGIMRG